MTRISVKGNSLEISPDLNQVFTFLTKIANEVSSQVPKSLDQNTDLYIRSACIIIFSFLDVIYSIYCSFEFEIDSKKELLSKLQDFKEYRKFINTFLLDRQNLFFKNNRKNFGRIDAQKLKNLRNTLVHFYSVYDSEIILVHGVIDDINIKGLEKMKERGEISGYLSPEDLFELVNGSFGLMLQYFIDTQKSDQDNFIKKIFFVKSIVNKYGVEEVSF